MTNYVMLIENISLSLQNSSINPQVCIMFVQYSAPNKTVILINISLKAVREMLFTQTFYYGNVQDTELLNFSTGNTCLPNLTSGVSSFEV